MTNLTTVLRVIHRERTQVHVHPLHVTAHSLQTGATNTVDGACRWSLLTTLPLALPAASVASPLLPLAAANTAASACGWLPSLGQRSPLFNSPLPPPPLTVPVACTELPAHHHWAPAAASAAVPPQPLGTCTIHDRSQIKSQY